MSIPAPDDLGDEAIAYRTTRSTDELSSDITIYAVFVRRGRVLDVYEGGATGPDRSDSNEILEPLASRPWETRQRGWLRRSPWRAAR